MTIRAELVVLLAGMALITLAAASVDLRLGLATAGLLLVASAIDFRGLRR